MPGAPLKNTKPTVIITIDGPAGTGKSTVAYGLARRLGLDFLDTGAMYRAAAFLALQEGLAPNDGPAIAGTLLEADLHFDWTYRPPKVMLGDRDVSRQIRGLEVSASVSVVAAQQDVRRVLVAQQRRIAERHPRLISEGRDQGSVVFPDASLRFYLDADVSVRARRRAAQLVSAGQEIDDQQVIDDIRRRDQLDATRRDSPLVRPEGAIVVDTGERSASEVIDLMESISRERLPEAGFKPS